MIFRSFREASDTLPPLVEGVVVLQGEMAFHRSGVLHGSLDGTVSGSQALVVAADAEVKGGVKAGALDLHGRIEGWVRTERGVILEAGSELNGPVRAGALEIKEGARFRGVVTVLPKGS